MKKQAEQFLAFAAGTRSDFHEPDEQGIRFVGCRGSILDNAFGVHPQGNEVVVVCEKDGEQYEFNLANLMALAKRGAEQIVKAPIFDRAIEALQCMKEQARVSNNAPLLCPDTIDTCLEMLLSQKPTPPNPALK